MCGRMNISDQEGIQALMDDLGLPLYPDRFERHYNVAPSAQLLTAFAHDQQPDSTMMEWGIVPRWAKADKPFRPLINARAETIREKPSFRHLIQSTRAIIPATGFYEWRRENDKKTPFYITPTKVPAFAFAAIYQVSKEGVLQCCVITISANHAMQAVHDRMPVILDYRNMRTWLTSQKPHEIDALMVPARDDSIQLRQVSSFVNNARNDSPDCMK